MADLFLRPSRTVRVTVRDQGAMLLDIRGRGRWYTLPASGARWWTQICSGLTCDQAADLVASSYDADLERVRADMRVLAQQLMDRRLLNRPHREPIPKGWVR
jgi:hypothetical protein